MDKLKAQMNIFGGATNATAVIETTEANLPGALKLATEILREPSFPDNEFETLRQQRIAAAESGRSDPQALAVNEVQRKLNPFPRGHVLYVAKPDETIEELKKVTLDDVRKFYRDFYGASAGEIAISGQFNPQETQKLLGELFANWKSPAGYTRITDMYQKVAPEEKTIETPDKQNAVFLSAEPMKITDDDPEYPAMIIGNYLLGGSGFGSRLLTRIRDKDGLSYGVVSQFSAPTVDNGGSFLVFAISAPQNTPKVEAAFREELTKVLKDGFTKEEVDAAKKSWAQERIVNRSQDGAMAGLLTTRTRFDRTLDYDKQVEAKVAALTPDQIVAAMRKLIDPAQLSFVRAGDFKKAAVLQ
jgi:zinc protease